MRNCVAVGADPRRIAILDNFCWGNTDRPETLGSLVRAALACHDLAIALGTPFISGKDSLNNEFRHRTADGREESIAIPPSLLISALGQVDDVAHCVTMDLKEPGNLLFIVGQTKEELGGSHFALVGGCSGGEVPKVDAEVAARTFAAVHQAIAAGTVRACHDLSEVGLAVALAEMAFAGGLGVWADLNTVPREIAGPAPLEATQLDVVLLFSESNTRFVCEVPPSKANEFSRLLADVPHASFGEVRADSRLELIGTSGAPCLVADIARLKAVWKKPLDW
jgi:phosphoribosylformylglycinamidine synthase